MTNITVIKRDGKKEPLMIEKWQTQIAKVCKEIADVSQSMIEIKSQPHFYDGITTKEIDEITLRAIVDLIDIESNPDLGHTNYQYVAGKQRLSMLRKDVYGQYEPPHLYEIVKRNVATGLYTNELLEWYSEEDWNKMNDMIDHSKDEQYGYASIEQQSSIEKNPIQQECDISKSIIPPHLTACLLLQHLCWLVLALRLNSLVLVFLSAVMTTWIAFLLQEK